MPHKTVTCNICGAEVSKRKSLAFGDSRACREHKEVVEMLERQKEKIQKARTDQKQEEEIEKLNREIHESMQIIALGSYIQVQHSLYEVPVERLYNLLSVIHGKEKMDKVMKSLEDAGGAYVDPDELIGSAMAAMMAINKHKINKVEGK